MSASREGDGRLELRDLVKVYDDVVAVDRLDLTIEPGEFFSLLGASGCGKTTTLRLVAGFEVPDQGRVYDEREFHQAVEEVATSVMPFYLDHKHYRDAQILERLTEPDRIVIFRVAWEDDAGNVLVKKDRMLTAFTVSSEPWSVTFSKSSSLIRLAVTTMPPTPQP